MSRKILICCLLALWSLAATVRAEDSVPVKMDDVPAAAQKTIQSRLGKNGHIVSIEKSTDDGAVSYDVTMKRKGRMRDFSVSESGALLEAEMFLREVPAPVRSAIKQELGSNQLESITKDFDDDEISYEVDVTAKGEDRTFTVDDAGKLLDRQISLSALPGAAQDVIKQESTEGKLGDLTETFDGGTTNYEVVINPDGKTRALTFNLSGRLTSKSEDISLSETPAAAHRAIEKLLENARLGAIVKTTETNVVSYDVEFIRDGATESASIGADGKIIP